MVRYLGALLSVGVTGGLAKTILDHWLADRRVRRGELRPRDLERIETVRRGAREVVDTSIEQAAMATETGHAPSYPTKMQPETADATWTALDQLSDRRLRRRWRRLEERARTVPMASRGLQDDDEVQRLWDGLYDDYDRVTRRLTQLERRR